MSITRRLFLRHTTTAAFAATATSAMAVHIDADPETPVEKVVRLRRELIDASKELYPDIHDWRIITPDSAACEDNESIAGMFMIVGHRRRNKGGQRNG